VASRFKTLPLLDCAFLDISTTQTRSENPISTSGHVVQNQTEGEKTVLHTPLLDSYLLKKMSLYQYCFCRFSVNCIIVMVVMVVVMMMVMMMIVTAYY